MAGPGYNRRELIGALGAAAFVGACSFRGSERQAASDLKELVDGPVWARDSQSYEHARSAVWCANVPARYPAVIVRASSASDVAATVRYAARNGLRVAIRGGGHNWSAASLRDGAVMIDLGGLTQIVVDPSARRATVQPGVSGGALMQAALAHGLVFPIAHCPSVPMSGFLLNGGYGFNAGDWGPSALLIESMEIVLPDGETVIASETQNPDLFWAARGGGSGFFGIVTRFILRLLPAKPAIMATNYIFPLQATEEATAALQAARVNCPDNVELTFLASAGAGPPQSRAVGVVSGIAFGDDEAHAARSLDFLDDFAAGGAAIVTEKRVPMTWPGLFEAVAALFPPKMHYLGNTIWTDADVSDLYTPYARHLADAPTPQAFSNCVLYPPGFAERARKYDAALSMQGGILSLQYAIWTDPADSPRNEEWFRRSTALFASHAHGHYIGETDLNLFPELAPACYSEAAWRRLSALRDKYDPNALFFDFLGQRGSAA